MLRSLASLWNSLCHQGFRISTPWRIIILINVSMMFYFGVPILLGSILIHGTISSKVSYFIACITSELRWIPSYKIIFLMRMLTLVMMIFPSSFPRVYCESLIFTSIFSSRVAIWASSCEHSSHSLLNLTNFFLAQIPWMK